MRADAAAHRIRPPLRRHLPRVGRAAVEELRRVGAGSAAWNQLVPAFDRWFPFATRRSKGATANPINEVRVIAESVIEHGSVMTVPRGIKLDPEASVLGFAAGKEICPGR